MTACQNVTTIITLAISMFFNKVLLNVTIPSNSNGFAPKSVISNSLFPQNCSLSISTLSFSLHRFKFSFKIHIFQNCMNSEKKKVRKLFLTIYFKKFSDSYKRFAQIIQGIFYTVQPDSRSGNY